MTPRNNLQVKEHCMGTLWVISVSLLVVAIAYETSRNGKTVHGKLTQSSRYWKEDLTLLKECRAQKTCNSINEPRLTLPGNASSIKCILRRGGSFGISELHKRLTSKINWTITRWKSKKFDQFRLAANTPGIQLSSQM